MLEYIANYIQRTSQANQKSDELFKQIFQYSFIIKLLISDKKMFGLIYFVFFSSLFSHPIGSLSTMFNKMRDNLILIFLRPIDRHDQVALERHHRNRKCQESDFRALFLFCFRGRSWAGMSFGRCYHRVETETEKEGERERKRGPRIEENVTVLWYFCLCHSSDNLFSTAKNQRQINRRAISLAPSVSYISTIVATRFSYLF